MFAHNVGQPASSRRDGQCKSLLPSYDGLTPSMDATGMHALDSLEIENGELKRLVVRLSDTIIKNVVTRR
jgi:hypothetical protein